ncbi:ribosomal protein S18-alanine N-acetyltransferase [Tumidithrix elongata RA019]|uniref:Ribosomal protein S18-alanine N-acetyltransferase n=1 Tax=Tumidithrix elongata BACA0141 TaxID=2716417 RepID=A0AAW9Q0K1_9CYAN|nr:ribosomal protein S18-alanine N-acetyltransferase [Tumidithrix elongata RA019]
MQVRLVEITKALLSQIHAIDRTCLGGLWSLEAYEREVCSPNSYLVGIMSPENVILGFGCLWSILEEAHITILAVRPEYQRQGLGSYLVWGLLKAAHDRSLEWATLEVRASNQPAIALYQKFGFTEVGRRRNYYQVTGEDALILWCKGTHTPAFGKSLQIWQQDLIQVLASKGWVAQI